MLFQAKLYEKNKYETDVIYISIHTTYNYSTPLHLYITEST